MNTKEWLWLLLPLLLCACGADEGPQVVDPPVVCAGVSDCPGSVLNACYGDPGWCRFACDDSDECAPGWECMTEPSVTGQGYCFVPCVTAEDCPDAMSCHWAGYCWR